MILFGQQETTADLAQIYLVYCIPGLWARAVALCIQNWLHSQQHVSVIAYVLTIVAFFNVCICYLMVVHFEYGFVGASIAMSISRVVEALLLVLYLVYNSYTSESLLVGFHWSHRCLSNWLPYFQLAVPNLVMVAEWWASEILIFMSGTLLIDPELQVSSMSIYQNMISICKEKFK